jgi:hypothetical protein
MICFLIAGTVNATDFSIYYILFHFFPLAYPKVFLLPAQV